MRTLISFLVFTIFWLLFILIGWMAAKRFKEKGLIRCCFLLTGVCCWLIWVITFLMQLNPLTGPRASQKVIYAMMTYWENSFIHHENDP
ncbi:uncharacterized protein Dwil_GK18963 [Drosophila willistoni]|uniref:V-type proton ATPase subunit n=1 Tax=Drosophila willistoni TaxID=7260 RepID=B4NJG1_DROWI|nr:V-type proton ATPase subunit e [Drosophila willistoni]EDW83885.1 uncharacterized protein Dwil_GK18963 [Drosophila willistoni]